MELVLATSSFGLPGGSETYLLTVAAQLQRLGHQVTLYALTLGGAAEIALARGLRVTDAVGQLPPHCDAALVQDGVVAYRLAERYPQSPQLFRAASELHDFQLPPNLPGVVSKVIVLSDRVTARIRAMAVPYELVRLRQPIDTEVLKPLTPIRAVPRRAVLLGNYLRGARRERIVAALGTHGVECEQIGLNGSVSRHPEEAILEADIVVAKGRAALDGMACGRAVYLYDEFGTDGWVTAAKYPAMEADNFAGQATDVTIDGTRLDHELAEYDAGMGLVNRDLVLRNHGARYHVNELCALFAEAAAPSPPLATPLLELARLVRLQSQTAARVEELERSYAAAWAHGQELQQELTELADAYRRIDEITGTRRYRIGMALGLIADRLRARTRAS